MEDEDDQGSVDVIFIIKDHLEKYHFILSGPGSHHYQMDSDRRRQSQLRLVDKPSLISTDIGSNFMMPVPSR